MDIIETAERWLAIFPDDHAAEVIKMLIEGCKKLAEESAALNERTLEAEREIALLKAMPTGR